MTTFPTTYAPTPDPRGHAACARLGGCLGTAWCNYCGQPMPTRHDARQRLERLINQARGATKSLATVGESHARSPRDLAETEAPLDRLPTQPEGAV